MSEPDIIENLGNGISRTTIIQAVEITRQGENGGWRIALPLTKVVVLPDGSTADQPAASIAYNLAELAHDPAVVALYLALRDVTIRIARGDLKPLPPPAPEPEEPSAEVEEPT